MSDLSVYAITPIGKVPLHALAPVGKIAFSTTFGVVGGCGLDEMSFSMTLPRGYSNPLLVQGTVLELRIGSTPLGRSTLTTIDFDSGAVTATGLFKRGVDFIGFASLDTFAGTLNPKTALQNAITQGLEWNVDAATLAQLDVTLATTGTSANLDDATWYSIADLLDAYCTQRGANVFWGIDPGGFLRIYMTPAAPSYMLSPSVPAMDSTTTDYVTDLVCRFSDINKPVGDGSTFYASAVMATVPVRAGSVRKFANADITDHGPLTTAQAQDIANQTLAAKSPTLTYNGGVDVSAGDVRTLDGGAPVPPWRVVAEAGAGTMLRHHGWRNMQGALMPGFAQEWVIGKATYADTGAVNLSPTADAAKTLGQMLSSTVNQIAEVGKQVQQNDQTIVVGALHAELAQAQQSLEQAQADIDSAHADIDSALNAAQTALTAANGKNKVTYSAAAPTDSSPGQPGDLWFQWNAAFVVTAQYVCTAGTGAASGNTWQSQSLNGSLVAAGINAGNITTGTIAAARIGAKSITADKMVLASTDSLWIDPFFTSLLPGGVAGATPPSGNGLRSCRIAIGTYTIWGDDSSWRFPVAAGDEFLVQWVAKRYSGTAGLRSWMRLYTNNDGTGVTLDIDKDAAGNQIVTTVSDLGGSWSLFQQVLKAPTSGTYAVGSLAWAQDVGGGTAVWDVANVRIYRRNAGGLIVDGSIKASSLYVTQDVTGKNFIGGTFTGQTFIGAEFKTDTAGRRMEIGHNQSGGTDPSNIAFYNGFSGETPGLIGPWGGEAGGNVPALAISSPSQTSSPNEAQVNLKSGTTSTGIATAPRVTVNSPTAAAVNLVVSGAVLAGSDTYTPVALGLATGITNYGGSYETASYSQRNGVVTVSGMLKTANQITGGVNTWLASGVPAPYGGKVKVTISNASGTGASIGLYVAQVSGTWCIVLNFGTVAAGGWISIGEISYLADF